MTTAAQQLDAVFERVIQTSAQIYAEGDAATCHLPMAFALLGDTLHVLGIPSFGDDPSKEAVRQLFETYAAAGATVLAFVHEAWMARAEAQRPGHRIAELPPDDRQEILVLYAVSKGGGRYAIRRILRGRGKAALVDVPMPAGRLVTRFLSGLPWP
jgi:hypothetical protein